MLYCDPRQLDRLSVYRDFLAVIIHHKPAGAIDIARILPAPQSHRNSYICGSGISHHGPEVQVD